MNDNFDKAAIAVIIVFGALILGGLMAANIAWGHRNGFLWALGGATAAWIAGHIIANPEHGAAVLGLDGEEKSVRRWVLLRVLLHQRIVEIEGARRVVGCADIEHA